MRRILVTAWLVVVLATAGCQRSEPEWFTGDFDAAMAAAAASETLVMMDFYTDWCTWCKSLDEDTFSDSEVQAELAGLVVMKVNAERGGRALAGRFKPSVYPTMVFTNSAGEEVGRLIGYYPPDAFISEVRRIRSGK